MGAAKLIDPSGMIRAIVRADTRQKFQPHLFDWVERACGLVPRGLWLLDSGREQLSRFAGFDFGVLVDEHLSDIFNSHEGRWTDQLEEPVWHKGREQVGTYALPIFGDKDQSLGLITFDSPPKGYAWLRLLGLILELYLSRAAQSQERQALETLLRSARAPATSKSDEIVIRVDRHLSLKESLSKFEKQLLVSRLAAHQNTKSAAADSLGITYRSLASKCKLHDL